MEGQNSAIVHVDGTARVQTVREKTRTRMLYRLLKEFDALTGVPVLVNTSFNIKGEPIVETPRGRHRVLSRNRHRLSDPASTW